jgi:hypothetical protein
MVLSDTGKMCNLYDDFKFLKLTSSDTLPELFKSFFSSGTTFRIYTDDYL